MKRPPRKETSYGIVPVKQRKGQWDVLLVKHEAGHWAFPKGHPDEGETPLQTAERELKEETGLSIKSLVSKATLKERYYFTHERQLIDKTVEYFVAEVTGDLIPQLEEISELKWFTVEEAMQQATFPATRKLIEALKPLLPLS